MKILTRSTLLLYACVSSLTLMVACLERPKPGRSRDQLITTDTISGGIYRCYGRMPCSACSDCSQCRYCSRQGGTCGICTGGYIEKKETIANGITCRAMTKKNKRCKRSPRKSGYCWQHEGQQKRRLTPP